MAACAANVGELSRFAHRYFECVGRPIYPQTSRAERAGAYVDEAGAMVTAIEGGMLWPIEAQDQTVLRALIFDAGAMSRRSDPLTVFFDQDVPLLEWRESFLRDPDTDQLIDVLLGLSGEETDVEPEEITYSRADLTTLGSEVMPDD